ncbi:MAG: septum formation protein [Mariniblastus sp.]|jgi:septum formation protein
MTNRHPHLILASQSPRRRQLLTENGFEFIVDPPDESIEKMVQTERGICSKCSPEELVLESALVKAKAIANQHPTGLVLAADTVAECQAEILGKPVDRDHAERMLRLMSGQRHRVLTGVCLWHRPSDVYALHLEQTILKMDPLTELQLEEILDSDGWVGKAGAFGYQDGLDWLSIEAGLESTVVGLPVERLPNWIKELNDQAGQQDA